MWSWFCGGEGYDDDAFINHFQRVEFPCLPLSTRVGSSSLNMPDKDDEFVLIVKDLLGLYLLMEVTNGHQEEIASIGKGTHGYSGSSPQSGEGEAGEEGGL